MAANTKFSSAQTKCHFVIVGCGLGGLAAAIGIKRAGHDVSMLEKAAELQELGAGINITPNATVILKTYGLLEDIRTKAITPFAALMRSYKDSAELSRIDLDPRMEEAYLGPYMVLHRADLHSTLLKEAKRLGVAIRLNSHISRINPSEPSVELSSGEKYNADAILGADGERSVCRDALLGRSLPSQDSGDHVFRITVKISDVLEHQDLASLVKPPCINLWVGPGAHAMTYALKRDGLLNIVLTCAHDISHTVLPGPQKVDIREAREAFKDWDKKFQTLLGLATGCAKWTLLHTPGPAYWVHPDGKFALLGDAAHAMLPFLGQGAAMAFEDAAVIGVLVSKMQHKSQLPDILTIYERLRKPRTTTLCGKSRAMRDVYAFDDGPLQEERDRQLREHEPFDGYANFLADPGFQKALFGYNAMEEASRAWEIYLKGEWPSTRGNWKAGSYPS